MNRLLTTWWFGHVLLFAMSLGTVVVAILMAPSPDNLHVFGIEIPVVCNFRRLTGYPCPGCGMTRSFVYMAHGHPIDALWMNPFGPFLFLLVAGQIPYRPWMLWKGPRRARPVPR